MSIQSVGLSHLSALHTAQDVHDLFRQLGYPVDAPDSFEGDDLDALEFDPSDRANVRRAYIVSRLPNHTVYLYEVDDLRSARLRSLAWNVLERGTGLLIVTTPAERGEYRELVFVDPRFAGKPIKSSVRVNKLKVIIAEPTRHDLDTLNAIHAHRRTAQQVYDAQAAAFNVTTVTKRFYDDYRGHYERAKAAIKLANPGVSDFYDADKLHAFTQRLLGRLMFLYFLQRKGWLGERPRFLTERYATVQRRHAGESHDGETYAYYQEVLEPLFFQTMNTKRPGNVTLWEGIRIPYLNGGLFDEARDPSGPILIPDSVFDPNDVNGLLGFFNRYNFTIANDTPLEQDVAVDPEMLGKVFENLLEERDRGQSGSFYTPRPIVAYMCQEALAGYLEESASIPRETTRTLFDPDANATLTADEAEQVNTALDTLTVLDPAVGSGSFLIGMLNELLHLRHTAYAALHSDDPVPNAKTISDWKEAIIRDTLYGVDIKPEAIEIAQLRLWLALVVDQTLDQARPLPNLDYKLMAGNSLIETIDGEPVLTDSATAMLGTSVQPEQATLGLFETDHERRKLDEMRRDYFSASPEERKRLKPDILHQERRIVATALREKADSQEQIIRRLGKLAGEGKGTLKPADTRKLNAAAAKLTRLTDLQEAMGKPDYVSPFFLYRLHFSEVFERKGGFDIVVANPPYVRGELLGAQKDEFKVTPIYTDVYAGSADLYVYFYARGYHLLKQGGQLAYITSNKYLRANYGKGLRKFLAEKVAMRAIIDFGDLPLFDVAAYPCIVIGSKASPAENIFAAAVKSVEGWEDLRAVLADGVKLNSSDLGEQEWQITDGDAGRLIEKIEATSISLGEYVKGQVYRGVTTGYNEAFVIDEAKRAELISADPKSTEVIKPWLRGRDVKRWLINSPVLYLIFTRRGIKIDDYPAIKAHLEQFKSGLLPGATGGRKEGSYEWFEIQDNTAYFTEFDKPKIIYQKFQVEPAFTVDYSGYFVNDAMWFFTVSDYFLLGCLNSKVGWHEISRFCTHIQNGYQLIWKYLMNVRLPIAPSDLRDRIAAAAQACLNAAKDHPDRLPALEGELNRLVYQAYGLDDEDIAVIEGSVGDVKNRTGVSLDHLDRIDETED